MAGINLFAEDAPIAEETQSNSVNSNGVNLLSDKQPQQVNIEDERKRLLKSLNEDVGPIESFFVGTGRGMTGLGRAVGLVDEENPVVTQSFNELQRQRPISSEVGQVVGETAPFLLPGSLVGAIPNVGGRIIAGTALGVTEGGLIAKSRKQNVTEGAVAGGIVAGTLEVLFPLVSRFGGALVRKITGRTPTGAVIDQAGKPSAELTDALNKAGMTMDDLTDHAFETLKQSKAGTDPEQAARLARLQSLNAPATKGDITGKFAQQANEARLVESAADSIGEPLRSLRLEQSKAFKDQLDKQVEKLGLPDDVGDSIKEALKNRKKLLMKQKNNLYERAASQSPEIQEIPVMVDTIEEALPSPKELRRLSRIKGNQAEAVEDLLIEFGVIRDPQKVEAFLEAGGEIDQLKIGNFEEFRQALNQIERADTTKSTSVIIGPIKRALDSEGELIDAAIQKAGIVDDSILDVLKEARGKVRKIKTEFSPESITGKLSGFKRDGVTPVIESSKVFKELVGPQKAPELLERTIGLLMKSKEGKRAVGDLQAATILDLLDHAFKASTRKINNQRVFGGTAYNARLKQIGDRRLNAIFKNKKKALNKIKQIAKASEDLVPPSGAVPKGSATVILDQLNRLGIITIMNNIPGSVVLMETLKTVAEKGGNRKTLEIALDAKPDVKRIANFIAEDFPSLASVLGIGYLSSDFITGEE